MEGPRERIRGIPTPTDRYTRQLPDPVNTSGGREAPPNCDAARDDSRRLPFEKQSRERTATDHGDPPTSRGPRPKPRRSRARPATRDRASARTANKKAAMTGCSSHQAPARPAPPPFSGDAPRLEDRRRSRTASGRCAGGDHFSRWLVVSVPWEWLIAGLLLNVELPDRMRRHDRDDLQASTFMAAGPVVRPIGSPARSRSRTSKARACRKPAGAHEM